MTSQTDQRAPSGARIRFRRVIAGLAVLLWPSIATAFTAASLEQQVRDCAAIAERESRLDCFDAMASGILAEHGEPAASDAASREPDSHTAASPRRSSEPEPPPAEPGRVEAQIERVAQQPRGERVFFLSNGQIWQELEAGRARYRKGMTVTVERTTLGGYILSTDSGRATRVRQLQ